MNSVAKLPSTDVNALGGLVEKEKQRLPVQPLGQERLLLVPPGQRCVDRAWVARPEGELDHQSTRNAEHLKTAQRAGPEEASK